MVTKTKQLNRECVDGYVIDSRDVGTARSHSKAPPKVGLFFSVTRQSLV